MQFFHLLFLPLSVADCKEHLLQGSDSDAIRVNTKLVEVLIKLLEEGLEHRRASLGDLVSHFSRYFLHLISLRYSLHDIFIYLRSGDRLLLGYRKLIPYSKPVFKK